MERHSLPLVLSDAFILMWYNNILCRIFYFYLLLFFFKLLSKRLSLGDILFRTLFKNNLQIVMVQIHKTKRYTLIKAVAIVKVDLRNRRRTWPSFSNCIFILKQNLISHC